MGNNLSNPIISLTNLAWLVHKPSRKEAWIAILIKISKLIKILNCCQIMSHDWQHTPRQVYLCYIYSLYLQNGVVVLGELLNF